MLSGKGDRRSRDLKEVRVVRTSKDRAFQAKKLAGVSVQWPVWGGRSKGRRAGKRIIRQRDRKVHFIGSSRAHPEDSSLYPD